MSGHNETVLSFLLPERVEQRPETRDRYWTKEEIVRLKQLASEHIFKWSIIGKILNRTPNSCRSKFRREFEVKVRQFVVTPKV
jgi:hypothetical protein